MWVQLGEERSNHARSDGSAAACRPEPAGAGGSPLPLSHINGLVVGVLSSLTAGSTIIVDRRFSGHSFWARAERNRATWLNLVPAILSILASTDVPDPSPAGRIRDIPFFAPCRPRFPDTVEEHQTFVLRDPSGNLIEFKHYRDPRMMY